MTGQYADGDTSCRIPDCLLSRKPSVPSSASYEADAQGLHPCPTGAADTGAADTPAPAAPLPCAAAGRGGATAAAASPAAATGLGALAALSA
mmetsp:Transcript_3077/g.7690  ORF Transcript_3077/g.7690 Transcript_3077/m.7690 type:complete len:92 (+) Transcript_3077:908-1183(+)